MVHLEFTHLRLFNLVPTSAVSRRLLALCGFVFLSAPLPALGPNVLVNGGFENPYPDDVYAPDERPEGWSLEDGNDDQFLRGREYVWIDGVLMPQETVKEGRRCIKIQGTWHGDETGPRIYHDKLAVARGLDNDAYYLLQFWYRTSGIERADFFVRVNHYTNYPENPQTRPSSFAESENDLLPAEDWTPVSFLIRPIQEDQAPYAYLPDKYPNFRGTDALRIMFGLNNTSGCVYIDDVMLRKMDQNGSEAHMIPLNSNQVDPPAVDGLKPVFPPTDFYTIQRDERGVWWIVRPSGDPVWIIGMNNPEDPGSRNPAMSQWIQQHFAPGTYGDDVVRRLKAWNFTATIENDTPGSARNWKAEQRYMDFSGDSWVSKSWRMREADGGYWGDDGAYLADPYNPDWQARARQEVARDLTASRLDDPEMLGYYTDNCLPCKNLHLGIWSTHCSQVFLNWLATRYPTPQACAQAWSSKYKTFNFSSWNHVYDARADVRIHGFDDSPALIRDLKDFELKVWKDYFRFICTIIREREAAVFGADPSGMPLKKHLIFTNRFPWNGYPDAGQEGVERMMDAIRELNQERPGFYFDALAANIYPGGMHLPDQKSRQNMLFLERMSQRCGLPVFVSEFAIAGNDVGFPPSVRWRDRTVPTQADRARAYRNLMFTWSRLNFMLGGMWYQWYDGMYDNGGPSKAGFTGIDPADPKYDGRNSGFVDSQNREYTVFVQQVAEVNAVLRDTSRSNAVSVADFPWDTSGGQAPPPPREPRLIHHSLSGKTYLTWGHTDDRDIWNYVIHYSPRPNCDYTRLAWLGYVTSFEIPADKPGYYRVAISDSQRNEGPWTEAFHTSQATPLSDLTILSPASGEDVAFGEPIDIRWLPPAPTQQVLVQIQHLVDGQWQVLQQSEWMDNLGEHREWIWQELPDGTQLRAVVTGGNWDGSSFTAASAPFTFDNPKTEQPRTAARHWMYY